MLTKYEQTTIRFNRLLEWGRHVYQCVLWEIPPEDAVRLFLRNSDNNTLKIMEMDDSYWQNLDDRSIEDCLGFLHALEGENVHAREAFVANLVTNAQEVPNFDDDFEDQADERARNTERNRRKAEAFVLAVSAGATYNPTIQRILGDLFLQGEFAGEPAHRMYRHVRDAVFDAIYASCLIQAINAAQAQPPATSEIARCHEFREQLADKLQEPLKALFEDMSPQSYDLTEYIPAPQPGETADDFEQRVLNELQAFPDYRRINFCACRERPSTRLLAMLPPHIVSVAFTDHATENTVCGVEDDSDAHIQNLVRYYAFLPPHIKTIQFTLPERFGRALTATIISQLPATLERITIQTKRHFTQARNLPLLRHLPIDIQGVSEPLFYEHSDKPVLLPFPDVHERASYPRRSVSRALEAVFDNPADHISATLSPASRGMYNLLKHYLGQEPRNPDEGWIDQLCRAWRCKARQHIPQVETLLSIIARGELTEPQALLYAIKNIDPERRNANGGLQDCINFLQDHVATHTFLEQEEAQLPMVV